MLQFVQQNDHQAFEALVIKWDYYVFSFLARASKDLDVAEDLKQEVFLRILRFGSSYNSQYAFSTWLFRIAHNVVKTWEKEQSRYISADVTDEQTCRVLGLYDPDPNPCEQLEQARKSARLHSAISQLAMDDRILILLRYHLEFSYRKIGEITDAPLQTVKSRLDRILKDLRSQLQRTGLNDEKRRYSDGIE